MGVLGFSMGCKMKKKNKIEQEIDGNKAHRSGN